MTDYKKQAEEIAKTIDIWRQDCESWDSIPMGPDFQSEVEKLVLKALEQAVLEDRAKRIVWPSDEEFRKKVINYVFGPLAPEEKPSIKNLYDWLKERMGVGMTDYKKLAEEIVSGNNEKRSSLFWCSSECETDPELLKKEIAQAIEQAVLEDRANNKDDEKRYQENPLITWPSDTEIMGMYFGNNGAAFIDWLKSQVKLKKPNPESDKKKEVKND